MAQFQSVIRSILSLIVSGGAIKALNFVTLLLATRAAGPSGYGIYLLALSVISVAHFLSSVSSGQLIQAEIARASGMADYPLRKRLALEGLVWVGFVGLVIVLITHASTSLEFWGPLHYFVAPAALLIFTNLLKDWWATQLSGNGRFIHLGIWQGVEAILRLAILALVAALWFVDPLTLLAIDASAVLGGIALQAPMAARPVLRALPQRAGRAPALFSIYRGHGAWFLAKNFLVRSTASLRLWFIGALLGASSVAVFGIAKRLNQFFKTFMPIGTVLNTWYATHRKRNDHRRSFVLGLRLGILCGSFLFLIAIPLIIPLCFFGFPDYGWELAIVASILALNLSTQGISQAVIALLNAERLQKQHFFSTAFRLASMLSILPIFIFVFGIIGVAIEAVLANAAAALVGYLLLCRENPRFRLTSGEILKFTASDIVRFRQHVKFIFRR